MVKSFEILLFEQPENLYVLCIFDIAFQVTFLKHEDRIYSEMEGQYNILKIFR